MLQQKHRVLSYDIFTVSNDMMNLSFEIELIFKLNNTTRQFGVTYLKREST